VPTISQRRDYDGAALLIERLGLAPLVRDLTEVVTGFVLSSDERAKPDAAIQKTLDRRFSDAGWLARRNGAVDWMKCASIGDTQVCVSVALHVSGPSDLVVAGICRLRDRWADGHIDIGVLVVPDDELGHYLTDRGPKFSDAVRHVRAARAEDFPLLILGLHHDGPGEPLAKQFKAS
jgi:hypothetical protein